MNQKEHIEDTSVMTLAGRAAKSLLDARDARARSANLDASIGSIHVMFPHVYQDLHRLGRSLMRSENQVQLQVTAVVNEAYIRLASIDPKVHDLNHCFHLVAQTMRRVLIDHGRARRRGKRELPSKEELEALLGSEYGCDTTADGIDLDRAMDRLAEIDSEAAEIIQLSGYFGVDHVELANIFGISDRTVTRKIQFGTACLERFLGETRIDEPRHSPSIR